MASVGGLFFMTKLKKRSWEMNVFLVIPGDVEGVIDNGNVFDEVFNQGIKGGGIFFG